jgi:starch phosphorylase
MISSFLPQAFAPLYQIDPAYAKSVVYFSMEYAIDQSFKVYSGGLGFLAGSHMRSAAAMRQNFCGIGIFWTCGYYNQTRGEDREMAVQFRRKHPTFLRDTGIEFSIRVYEHDVRVRALYLPGDVFHTVPMFFLTTDIEGNSPFARNITQRLYDHDHGVRIAQYMLLGLGGAKLLEELGVEPEVYHLNEAHGLSAAFRYLQNSKSKAAVQSKFVFTTHTPEEAGNEKTDIHLLKQAGFFGDLSLEEVRQITGIHEDTFNHSLAALRLARKANGVSKLHGEVSRHMWQGYHDLCTIDHVTNAQNKKYWADLGLEAARLHGDLDALCHRKRELKESLFRTVADQSGKLFDHDVLTIVWARRFAGYKRADLITRERQLFRDLLANTEMPVQIIWAGKPYPFDYGATDVFNELIKLTMPYPNATVLVGYELDLSAQLKCGSDVWLNNPVVTREASGTSGMSAAMNASLNFSTWDGWICEFGKDGENSFISPPVDPHLTPEARDREDLMNLYGILQGTIMPLYYQKNQDWWKMVLQSMNDVTPFFDSNRMVREYYEKMYTVSAETPPA